MKKIFYTILSVLFTFLYVLFLNWFMPYITKWLMDFNSWTPVIILMVISFFLVGFIFSTISLLSIPALYFRIKADNIINNIICIMLYILSGFYVLSNIWNIYEDYNLCKIVLAIIATILSVKLIIIPLSVFFKPNREFN